MGCWPDAKTQNDWINLAMQGDKPTAKKLMNQRKANINRPQFCTQRGSLALIDDNKIDNEVATPEYTTIFQHANDYIKYK